MTRTWNHNEVLLSPIVTLALTYGSVRDRDTPSIYTKYLYQKEFKCNHALWRYGPDMGMHNEVLLSPIVALTPVLNYDPLPLKQKCKKGLKCNYVVQKYGQDMECMI